MVLRRQRPRPSGVARPMNATEASRSRMDHLECSRCGRRRDAAAPANLCECGAPLLVRYRLSRGALPRERLSDRPFDMWRYREILPAADPVTLGEGGTPLLPARAVAAELGLDWVRIKEEGNNPTGSFKARGLSAAVSMARRFGVKALAIPSAGNAGSALAAYAAAAGIPAHIFLPRDTPPLFFQEARRYGASVHEVEGTIRECAREMLAEAREKGWFDVSTLKEPYRIEGKKTLGYELAEQMGWDLPEWIFYPTGGGTGLIGMVKAFDEMEALGWIGSRRPRMVSVQAEGCAPIVRAFELGQARAEPWENPRTSAWGLRVPSPLGDFLILEGVRRTGGIAVAVTEMELEEATGELARREGIFAGPEGGAALAALRKLSAAGRIPKGDRVVLFNTGSGLKYLDNSREDRRP
jgi:threonine synthase